MLFSRTTLALEHEEEGGKLGISLYTQLSSVRDRSMNDWRSFISTLQELRHSRQAQSSSYFIFFLFQVTIRKVQQIRTGSSPARDKAFLVISVGLAVPV